MPTPPRPRHSLMLPILRDGYPYVFRRRTRRLLELNSSSLVTISCHSRSVKLGFELSLSWARTVTALPSATRRYFRTVPGVRDDSPPAACPRVTHMATSCRTSPRPPLSLLHFYPSIKMYILTLVLPQSRFSPLFSTNSGHLVHR